MENIKKYWNENLSDKSKIIIVSFFTFFAFICASMTNSIVSAYENTYPSLQELMTEYNCKYYALWISNKTGAYTLYLTKTDKFLSMDKYNSSINDTCFYEFSNDGLKLQPHDGVVISCSSNEYDYKNFKFIAKPLNITVYDKKAWSNYEFNNVTLYTNNSNLKQITDNAISKKFMKNTTTNFHRPPGKPTIQAETVEQIPVGIVKIMKIITPVGLVIFGLILGIYLIKRLVPLFL